MNNTEPIDKSVELREQIENCLFQSKFVRRDLKESISMIEALLSTERSKLLDEFEGIIGEDDPFDEEYKSMTCPEHGEVWGRSGDPDNFEHDKYCRECGKKLTVTTYHRHYVKGEYRTSLRAEQRQKLQTLRGKHEKA